MKWVYLQEGNAVAHAVDASGYPLDSHLRQRAFSLGNLAALWRYTYGDHERQQQVLQDYHAVLAELYQNGWDAELDLESELPDAYMPEEYLRRVRRV